MASARPADVRTPEAGDARQMNSGGHTLPREAVALLDEARAALEAAGFATK